MLIFINFVTLELNRIIIEIEIKINIYFYALNNCLACFYLAEVEFYLRFFRVFRPRMAVFHRFHK